MKTSAVILAAALLALAGCGRKHGVATTGPPGVSPPPMTVTVYRLRAGLLRPLVVRVPRTEALATAVLGALDVGVPISVAHGTAIVQLAKTNDARVAEIVYSLTQLRGIRRVDVAGRRGLTRSDFAGYVPPILVESPAAGAQVPRRFRVSGTASVFEATVVVEAVQGGGVIARRSVTASQGAPARGTFDTTLRSPPGPLTVRVFAPSAVDGSPQHEVDVSVDVR